MAQKVALIIWGIWFGTTMYSYTKHSLASPLLPNKYNNGCFFLYQSDRLITWPMHKTKSVICLRTLTNF